MYKRQVFRQWGLDTLPLEQSGMQGLYVVDGGKVVYQKNGAGQLEYTPVSYTHLDVYKRQV